MSSPAAFSTLSPELYLLIGDHLSFADRLNFASVNAQLRALFAPTQFSVLRFTNREADADAIKLVVDEYGHYVQQLSFECYFYPDTFNEDEDDYEPSVEDELKHFPQWTRDLLSGKRVEKPQAIRLNFMSEEDFFGPDGYWGDVEELGTIYIASDSESRDEILEKERRYIWRNVLRQLWSALSDNHSIIHLDIRNLVPREVSIWSTDKWRSFLARLRTLSIELWGSDNGAGWKSNTCGGYLEFQADLDQYFLNHTNELTYLKIKAYEESVYGADGRSSTRLALNPEQMPGLKVLELEECVLDPNLIEFLRSHAKSLQHLVLRECASRVDMLADDQVLWAEFFADVCSMEPSFTGLEVVNSVVSLSREETYPPHALTQEMDEKGKYARMSQFVPPAHEAENIKAIRKAVKEGERRLFRHITIDDKYGMIFESVGANIERFEAGDDQREYDRLMSVIARNARASARG